MFASRPNIPDEYPLDMEIITHMQREEIASRTEKLKEYICDHKLAYTRSKFENDEVIMFKEKIYTPIALRKRILNWYHLYLCHPGGTRLGKTIQQAYDWIGLIAQAALVSKKCGTCQKLKKTDKLKYGEDVG